MSGISKRVSGSWVSGDYGIMKTATDTITTLPADLYADGNTATVGLKGNMYQASGVSPTTPIQPQECGDLETSGEHSGQYKIPILSANTTTPVYLGEVHTTRKIYKFILDGTEDWKALSSDNSRYYLAYLANDYLRAGSQITYMCTHYIPYEQTVSATLVPNLKMSMSSGNAQRLYITDANFASADDFKDYLAQQYANGTPVCVWYVLATPQTAVVNEPLRKIGEYADTVSGITIPTIAGANSLSVDTTLQPSEVTVNYKGWHPVADVHERENGQWN